MNIRFCAVAAVVVAALVITIDASFAANYEKPPVLAANKVLPADILKGPDYQVVERVINDGYMNTYGIRTRFGNLEVVSTILLRKRIHEIAAIALMEKAQSSDEFKDSFVEGGEDIINGAEALVKDPVGAVSGAITGIGKAFNRAAEGLFRSRASQKEDDRFKSIIGFSKSKRVYAKRFGVDVYSTNPILQQYLNDLAWAGYAGGMSMSAATAMVPGSAGLALTVTGTSTMLNDVIADSAPTDLRQMNRGKLLAMGIDETVANLFIDNTVFSPREQTILVDALSKMTTTSRKDQFIRFAITTDTEDAAFFRQISAQMYNHYHQQQEKIREFVTVAGFPMARTESGRIFFAVPVDYLIWSQNTARIVTAINQQVKASTATTGVELWLTGQLSPQSKKQLQTIGWRVVEKYDIQSQKTMQK